MGPKSMVPKGTMRFSSGKQCVGMWGGGVQVQLKIVSISPSKTPKFHSTILQYPPKTS